MTWTGGINCSGQGSGAVLLARHLLVADLVLLYFLPGLQVKADERTGTYRERSANLNQYTQVTVLPCTRQPVLLRRRNMARLGWLY
jgi:hypothetical protein